MAIKNLECILDTERFLILTLDWMIEMIKYTPN